MHENAGFLERKSEKNGSFLRPEANFLKDDKGWWLPSFAQNQLGSFLQVIGGTKSHKFCEKSPPSWSTMFFSLGFAKIPTIKGIKLKVYKDFYIENEITQCWLESWGVRLARFTKKMSLWILCKNHGISRLGGFFQIPEPSYRKSNFVQIQKRRENLGTPPPNATPTPPKK